MINHHYYYFIFIIIVKLINLSLCFQLRQESNTEPRKRFHLISKLKKAYAYATQVQSLCNVSVKYFKIGQAKKLKLTSLKNF